LEDGKIINLMKSKILHIAGDASFRTFYRIKTKKKNKILIHAKKEKYRNLIIYSAINKFLRKRNILTPNTLYCDYQKGIIIIEDFGDVSAYKAILNKKNKFIIYKKLVNFLIKIQKIKINAGVKLKTITKKDYKIQKYSIKKLHKETDLFFDWYLPLIFSKKKTLSIKKSFKKVLSKLYKKINLPNSYFVHRDYHVQNLMLTGNRIGIIDSQDALIGNPAYDLASLVDDVRIKLPKKLKDNIYNYYIKKSTKVKNFDINKFQEDFNILSTQRSLKIIGIFSRLFLRDNKKKYLKLIPYTWKLLDLRIKSNTFLELKKKLDENISKKIRKKILYK